MKKSLYICNANTTQCVVKHTNNTAINSVFPCGTSAPRSCVVFAKLIQGVRSLFVHTKQTCYIMRTPNKQATKAKYSNLSQTIILGTLLTAGLLLLINNSLDGVLFIIEKLAGGALMLLANALFYRWKGNDLTEYENEFYYNDGTPIR